jgi:hypothetical protein
MPRRPGGIEYVELAQGLLKRAKSANEVRQAQSVLLPLVLGLSIEQTALAIGRSVAITCSMRTRFGRVAAGTEAAPRTKHELRNRAAITLERERQLLARAAGSGRSGSAALVSRLKSLLEDEIGRSSVYRMLQRHGWRHEVTRADRETPGAMHPERRRAPAPGWVRD